MKGTYLDSGERGFYSRCIRVPIERLRIFPSAEKHRNDFYLPFHLFNKVGEILLSTYCVLSTVVDTRDIVENRTESLLSRRTHSSTRTTIYSSQ